MTTCKCKTRKRGRRVCLTVKMARAAAEDAANAHMRRSGRTHWSAADYAEAVRVEVPWRWSERTGIKIVSSVSDVRRKKDL